VVIWSAKDEVKNIVTCMALHNFFRDHDLDDLDFQLDVEDTTTNPNQPSVGEGTVSGDETDMGALCDAIATALGA
jgi:hypothetical protein